MTSETLLGDFNTGMMVAPGGGGPLTYEQLSVAASWRVVSSGYLPTLGVPLLRGRYFAEANEPSRSMLLSEGLAKRLFPDGADAVGQTVRLGNGQNRNVVGVVGDVRQVGLGEDVTPTMYMPTTWIVTPTMTLIVRSEGEPDALVAPIRTLAERVSPANPLFDIRSMGNVIDTSVAEPRNWPYVWRSAPSPNSWLPMYWGARHCFAWRVWTWEAYCYWGFRGRSWI